MPFIIILILLFVHELGHFLCAFFLGFQIDKISFYPYGGVSTFTIPFTNTLLKEFLVLIMGPIFQIICCLIITKLSFFSNYNNFIYTCNYTILAFNLLPIYPLDGGKLLNIMLNIKLSFKRSFNCTLYFSYFLVLVIIIISFLNSFKLNIFLTVFLLIYKISEEYKRRNYYFEKFLLERYLTNYRLKKTKEVRSIDCFMRNKKHLIKRNNRYYTEKEILQDRFKT